MQLTYVIKDDGESVLHLTRHVPHPLPHEDHMLADNQGVFIVSHDIEGEEIDTYIEIASYAFRTFALLVGPSIAEQCAEFRREAGPGCYPIQVNGHEVELIVQRINVDVKLTALPVV